ncbi:hypothetical protein QR680_014813 [Steinernema hermaphroditum]|uniref:Uncharacterized protein n=1 Tax=Steinernema hermaphroditum TaxID=289476 RepID=A0AA39IA61_9BILA|nr:hypothetical protein QR680_014813 [Steinernema hermaphroditum]
MSSKELWRILMLKPNLETLDISVLTGVPISLLTSQGRGNLPKIKSLSICRAQATLQDLIFLKDEVSSDTHVSSVTFKSDSEIAEFIKSLLANPSNCDLGYLKGCNFENIAKHLQVPELKEFGKGHLYCETPTYTIHMNSYYKLEATYDVVMAIQMPAFLIVFWSWLKITRFYGWCEKKKKMFPKYVDLYQISGQTRFFFTHDGLARRYEKMANYSIFKDVDNILIIAAEFIFELAQNTQFSIAPNVLVAPFSAIRATLMFLIM